MAQSAASMARQHPVHDAERMMIRLLRESAAGEDLRL